MRAIIERFIFKDVTTLAMVILFGLPVLVFLLIGYKKLFNKCNEKGWQAFIPIYNTYILGEIAGVHWYYSLIANSFFIVETLEFYEYEIVFYLISLLGKFIINYNIGKIFHKDYTYVILMTILPFPMYTIMGFNKDRANLKVELTKNGPIDSKSTLYDTPVIIEEPVTETKKPKRERKKLDIKRVLKKLEAKEERKTVKEEIIEEQPTTPIIVKRPTTRPKTVERKARELTKEEMNTYDIPIIQVSFDKDNVPNSTINKEEIIDNTPLSDDELLDIILKKKKERKPRPKTSPKNKKKKAVKRLKQRKKSK